MNVERLRATMAALKEEPRRFNMSEGILDTKPYSDDHQALAEQGVIEEPPCRTTCCFAGQAFLLQRQEEGDPFQSSDIIYDHRMSWIIIYSVAEIYLDLPDRNQSTKLFHVGNWPPEFYQAYNRAITPQARVAVMERRLEHFIATKGKE